jgi:phosphatidylglycerophosphate synthase
MYNLIAFLLLFIADILDNTDGQLARMTGKKSALGRILDGLAGYAWYGPIYIALVYRFYVHHDIEFQLLGLSNTTTTVVIATVIVFILATISGLAGIAPQQRIADYLDERCAAIDSVIDTRTRQLERLDDYRRALIFAYVTGKKEVPA